jgi:hypothetical protein
VPGSVQYKECEYVHRPVGDALVKAETALRSGQPFSEYDPINLKPITALFDYAPLKVKEGFDKRADVETSLMRTTANVHGIKERGIINERFGTSMILSPTDIRHACGNLYDGLAVEPTMLRFGESTRVEARNKQFAFDMSKPKQVSNMQNVKPASVTKEPLNKARWQR